MTQPVLYQTVVVQKEAMEWDGTPEGALPILDWMRSYGAMATLGHAAMIDKYEITIPTLEGDMKAGSGWFIIKGLLDEFYPCKPEAFAKSYEKVNVEE